VKNVSRNQSSLRALCPAFLLVLLLPGMGRVSSRASAQTHEACPVPETLTRGFQGPMAHVRFLADDALEGREAASHGARCASEYIAAHFRDLGLTGAGPDGSFFQGFDLRMGSELAEGNSLTVQGRAFELNNDWIPLGFSASGTVTAPLVYGGFGVSRPGEEDDVYAHLDLEGKIVVVEAADPHPSGTNTVAGDLHFKSSVAAGRGASGIIFLLSHDQTLPRPEVEAKPSLSIPAIAISASRADEIRHAAEGGREAESTTAVEPRMLQARNVAAMIPGADPILGREVVVLGAHYDHLGFGGDGSLAPDHREVHNGADDNASGTAAIMEVARLLSSPGKGPARTILFLAFSAEEKGLLGAGYYVDHPLLSKDRTVAMINMDMVGRLRDNSLTVYGTGTAEEWPALLERVNQAQPQPFALSSIPDGFGASDHSEFYGEDIPVLMLFTNTHAEYHRPQDDWELINQEGLERVAHFAADLTGEVAGVGATDALAMTFIEGAGSPMGGAMTGDPGGRPSGRGGASMGTIPDMTPQDFGVRITGVREGSAADKAGLLGGDIIVEFAGKEIPDLYAYTYALRDQKPGDEVTVIVLRDGERLTLSAVLGG
jgi:aminopeptidase YwaD